MKSPRRKNIKPNISSSSLMFRLRRLGFLGSAVYRNSSYWPLGKQMGCSSPIFTQRATVLWRLPALLLWLGLHTGHTPYKKAILKCSAEGQRPMPDSVMTVSKLNAKGWLRNRSFRQMGIGISKVRRRPGPIGLRQFFWVQLQRYAHRYNHRLFCGIIFGKSRSSGNDWDYKRRFSLRI